MKKGFTLIEMLVVIGIIGILLAAAVASYARMDDRAKVEEAANTILAELRSLQKDANSGKSGCTGTQIFNGYQITFNSSTPKQPFRAQNICNSTAVGALKILPEKTLKGSVVVTTNGNFIIYPVNKGVDFTRQLTIENQADTIEYRITITTSGGMSVAKIR